MTEKYSPFHIRYVQPRHVEELLFILAEATTALSEGEIMAEAENWNYELAHQKRPVEQFTILRSLDLVQGKDSIITEKGRQLAQILGSHPNLAAEIFHLLFYTAWDGRTPHEKCMSWSYRCLCYLLWNRISTGIVRDALASQLKDEIQQQFPDAQPSVGPDTVRATLAWLSPLDPPCLFENNGRLTFERRRFCSPELLLFAIDFIHRERQIPYASKVQLTDDYRDEICRLCMLNPESFHTVLNLALSQFNFIRKDIGGNWGMHLLLERQPELRDLL